MFFLTAVTFGVSYSMTKINIVDWIHSKWYFRLIRATLATGIAYGIEKLFELNKSADWLVTDIMPDIVIGFFIFGPFVLICVRLGLISEFNSAVD